MTAPALAAPLEKAVEESREALADARKIIDKWIIGYKGPPKSELAGHIIILADALSALLAALDADRGEAEAALRRYVRHNERCLIWAVGAPRCTCGLADALAAFDAAVRGDAVTGEERNG